MSWANGKQDHNGQASAAGALVSPCCGLSAQVPQAGWPSTQRSFRLHKFRCKDSGWVSPDTPLYEDTRQAEMATTGAASACSSSSRPTPSAELPHSVTTTVFRLQQHMARDRTWPRLGPPAQRCSSQQMCRKLGEGGKPGPHARRVAPGAADDALVHVQRVCVASCGAVRQTLNPNRQGGRAGRPVTRPPLVHQRDVATAQLHLVCLALHAAQRPYLCHHTQHVHKHLHMAGGKLSSWHGGSFSGGRHRGRADAVCLVGAFPVSIWPDLPCQQGRKRKNRHPPFHLPEACCPPSCPHMLPAGRWPRNPACHAFCWCQCPQLQTREMLRNSSAEARHQSIKNLSEEHAGPGRKASACWPSTKTPCLVLTAAFQLKCCRIKVQGIVIPHSAVALVCRLHIATAKDVHLGQASGRGRQGQCQHPLTTHARALP